MSLTQLLKVRKSPNSHGQHTSPSAYYLPITPYTSLNPYISRTQPLEERTSQNLHSRYPSPTAHG